MPARKTLDLIKQHQWLDEARFSLSAEHELKIREMAKVAVENDLAFGGQVRFPVQRLAAAGGYDTISVSISPAFYGHDAEALLMVEAQIREQW